MTLWAIAIVVVQFDNGTTETGATPYWPSVADRANLSLGELGTALMGMPLGLLAGGLLVAPRLVKRWGSRAAILAAPGFFVFFAAAVLASNPVWLFVALLFGGACNGVMDVGWTFTSTQHTKRSGRDNDQHLFELTFSVGSWVGAGWTALFLHLGTWPYMVLTALLISSTLWAARHLPAAPEREDAEEPTASTEDEASEPARLGVYTWLCVLRFFTFFPLGVAYAWSTPYLLSLGAAGGLAVLGLVAYTFCEGLSRLAAWKLTDRDAPRRRLLRRVWGRTHRVEPRTIVALGGFVGLGGALLVILPGQVEWAIVGFGLIGLGLGPATPEAKTAAARTASAGNQHWRMSLFTIVGYASGVLAPPLIGWTASAITLRWSLLFVALSAFLVFLASRAIPKRVAH